MGDLISKDKVIKELNDWSLSESPEFYPDVALEYTARDMQSMVYRTIMNAIQLIEEQPNAPRWIYDGVQIKGGIAWCHCSNCGGHEDAERAMKGNMMRCPDCGAIMG